MPVHTIENEFLSVTVSTVGAELQSLYSKITLTEYLWQGDKAFWVKRSPVLFPIIGGLEGSSYTYGDKSYAMRRHGFARDQEFLLLRQSDSELAYVLEDSAASMSIYPFPFRMEISYRLRDEQLEVAYLVKNSGQEPLWFSLGAHPAFQVPMAPGTEFADHYLEFESDASLTRWLLNQEGLLSGETKKVPLSGQKIFLNESLFASDALVMKDMESTWVRIASDKHERFIQLYAKNWPFYGIWSKPGAPFVCLEPWCGIASTENGETDLNKKEGIIPLEAGAEWENQWQVQAG